MKIPLTDCNSHANAYAPADAQKTDKECRPETRFAKMRRIRKRKTIFLGIERRPAGDFLVEQFDNFDELRNEEFGSQQQAEMFAQL